MGKQKLRGKDLRKLGFPSDKSKSIAINIMAQHFKYITKNEKLELLEKVIDDPKAYADHEYLAELAECFIQVIEKEEYTSYKLDKEEKPYRVFGKKFISQQTIHQMDLAMSIPCAVSGALMPDAHVGYGLPIGGVLATKNEIIPYAVGLDIGCRMALTIFDTPGNYLSGKNGKFEQVLKSETHFGLVKQVDQLLEHEVLDRSEFRETELLRTIHGKAVGQLGTSGGGNHFVEFGTIQLEHGNYLNLPSGEYVALMSHSGSRGLGATVANYYKKVAMDRCRLPQGTQHLAWLDMDSAEGQEYWMSMNLAGDYAKACHDIIHQKIKKKLGLKSLAMVENHHNFAWKEKQINGEEWIVHRKGSTPAQYGVPGIIPGSMASPAYLVTGKGHADALNSASHGAGRKFSRSKARSKFTSSDLKKHLKKEHVKLMGGGVDESPFAYKNITEVIGAQGDLINIEGTFTPRIVRME